MTPDHTPDALYHYTTADWAREVFDDPGEAYVEINDGTYGPGFYALDLPPSAAPREQLRFECYGDSRFDHPMDGVLVLDPGLSEPNFEHCDDHIWIMPVDPPDREPIGHMVVGIGVWKDGKWQFSEI